MDTSSRSTDTPVVGGIGFALTEHRHNQAEALPMLRAAWDKFGLDYDVEWVEHFFEHVGVDTRHFALPAAEYGELDHFGAANDRFIEVATDLGARAVEEAAADAGLSTDDLDAIFFTTVTGVASPSIDAKVINRLELPRHIRRTPMFGLGCVGGAAGLARMSEYLRANPDHTAVLLAVELCSLTVERNDPSMADYIAAALFGDGATAVMGLGSEVARRTESTGARLLDNHSAFYHDTEWVMGWEIDHNGFNLVLSGDLPEVIETELAAEVDAFLGRHDLTRDDIGTWISHPGGPKVLEAIETALELDDDELALAWESLAEVGNMSSASVLHVLQKTLARSEDPALDAAGPAVLMAMGPGFAAEFVLLDVR